MMSRALPGPGGVAFHGGIPGPDGLWRPQIALVNDYEVLDAMNAATGWSAFNSDCTGLTTDLDHVLGTASLEFDKVDGAANTVYAIIQKTLSPTVDLTRFDNASTIEGALKVSAITNVAAALVRLGTDASNYTEWQLADTSITAATWQRFSVALSGAGHAGVTGNGHDLSAIAYIAVGIKFDNEANTLADIRWDHLHVRGAQMTTT